MRALKPTRNTWQKQKTSIENLSKLYDNVTDKKTFSSTVSLLRIFWVLNALHLTRLLAGFFIRFRERMEIRLDCFQKFTYRCSAFTK